MPICDTCTSAIQHLYSHGWVYGKSRFQTRLPRYRPASLRQCWICYWFSHWLETEDPESLDLWREEGLTVDFKAAGKVHIASPGAQNHLGPLYVDILPLWWGGVEGCTVQLSFVLSEDIVEQGFIASEFKDSNCSGRVDFDLIRTWFDRCTKEHPDCRSAPTAPWYPTRLLRLGSCDADVQLIVSRDEPPAGPYMTLSHRWGSQEYTKLTTSTLDALRAGVDVDSLPRAFRDAMLVARLLGIGYLWIDALCIKQGAADLDDWAAESVSMDKVYSQAELNVSATLSHDGSESLFDQIPYEDDIVPGEIELRPPGSASSSSLPAKYYLFSSSLWTEEINLGPLNHRGWVFQERLLARRVLHFSPHQLAWECLSLEALSLFPGGLPSPGNLFPRIKSSVEKMDPASGTQQFAINWQSLVHQYSGTALTYPSDRLVAFDGIARKVAGAATHAGRYAAGLWESTLLYDLGWYRERRDHQIVVPENSDSTSTIMRPRVPSWSWASGEGQVSFPVLLQDVEDVFADGLCFVDGADDGRDNPGPGENDEPKAVQVHGICLPVDIRWLDKDGGDNNDRISSLEAFGLRFTKSFQLSIYLDIPGTEVQGLVRRRKVLLVPLFATVSFFHGILVTPIRGIGAHRRIGAVDIRLDSQTVESWDLIPQVGVKPSGDASGIARHAMGLELIRACHKNRRSARTIRIF